jgi:hypothetical protein
MNILNFFNKSFSNSHNLLSCSFQKKVEVFAIIEDNIFAIHNTHKCIIINLSKVIENWLVIIYHSG